MRSLSTPISLSLIWKLGSPAITRNTSIVTLGYSVPLDSSISGARLVTPSISGNVLTIPEPTALFSMSGTLAMIPGTLGIRY